MGVVRGQSPVDGQIRVAPMRQLRKGIDLWPSIVAPKNSAARQINTKLGVLNARLVRDVHGCDKDILAWVAEMHDPTAAADVKGDWKRTVEVTMSGPRFLSLKATESFFCGGVHPDSETEPMVFDLTTGALVDWGTLLPKVAGAAATSWEFLSDESLATVTLPKLEELSLAAAEADCKDAFDHPQPFLLWPDTRTGMLVAEPADLPHAAQACAEDLSLTMAQARELGFGEAFLDAIERGHALLPKRAAQAGKPGL